MSLWEAPGLLWLITFQEETVEGDVSSCGFALGGKQLGPAATLVRNRAVRTTQEKMQSPSEIAEAENGLSKTHVTSSEHMCSNQREKK